MLFFTAVRYYTKSAVWGFVFGISAALLFGALAFVYIRSKQNKKLLLSRDEKQKNKLALHLSLSSDGYIKKLFLTALGENAKISGVKIVSEGEANFFAFRMHPLSADDIAKVIKYRFDGKKRIYCNSISPEAGALAEHFLIDVKKIDEIYALLKQKNLLPEKYAYEESGKIKLLTRIKSRFDKRLAPPLFWSGAGLIALSFLTFYPIYYIVSGSCLLILAVISKVVSQS